MPFRTQPSVCLLLIISAALLNISVETDTTPRPNFIIVFADDQGYGDLGIFGATDFETPQIDRMAREGRRFTSFYAQPLCGPSRTALLTASYPIRVGEYGNQKNNFPYVHEQEVLLPRKLQEAGYATGMIGKGLNQSLIPSVVGSTTGSAWWVRMIAAKCTGSTATRSASKNPPRSTT